MRGKTLQFVLAIVLFTPIFTAAAGQSITLDPKFTGGTFEGIGALSAGASSRLLIDYPEPQRSEILDFLFKPKYGAGLQHLKVEIGGDVDSTDGTEPSIARTREEFANPKPEYFSRGYEWWLMKEAKKRNPKIVLRHFAVGRAGLDRRGQILLPGQRRFHRRVYPGAKKYHDLDISYCGCWNEKPYNTQWLKLLRKTLDKNRLTHVKIVAADEINQWTIADKMAKDAALREAIQVIGTHYPHFQSTPTARGLGKPVWANEEGPWSGGWAAAAGQCAGLAQAYNRNYVIGRMTKSIVWSPITAYYDILPLPGSGLMKANQPWSGHYEVQPAIWITAHTTQFIEPGWKYLGGSACGLLPGGGSHVAAISPDGKGLSLVIETMGAKEPQRLSFKLAGGLSFQKLHAWRSNAKEQFVRIADVSVSEGPFALDAEPNSIYSLTTTDGQQKGVTTIPKPRPMPIIYKEDFDGYAVGATPKYLSDFFGAFEVAEKNGGGKCLKQVITRRGIEWCGDSEPVTIVGSSSWRDYEVACDVCCDFRQCARIYGRIVSIPYGKQPPIGYGLQTQAGGAWRLAAAGKNLLEGKATLRSGAWHRFGLRMIADRLTVKIDGKEAGSTTDVTYSHGLAGIGCAFEQVKFDNFAIEGSSKAADPAADGYRELVRQPDAVTVVSETGAVNLKSDGDTWSGEGVRVGIAVRADGLHVSLAAPEAAVKQLRLHWLGVPEAGGWKYLGDAWERSYGELEWRGLDANRPMPWYFLASNGQRTHAYGVMTLPAALCCWKLDERGLTLSADVRCGGKGVQLGKRTLQVCTIVSRRGRTGETPFAATRAFCRLLCPHRACPNSRCTGSTTGTAITERSAPTACATMRPLSRACHRLAATAPTWSLTTVGKTTTAAPRACGLAATSTFPTWRRWRRTSPRLGQSPASGCACSLRNRASRTIGGSHGTAPISIHRSRQCASM